MSVLNTNKLTWLGNDGEPLKNGYVYVGQPGLDPLVEANRKEVTFTDSLGNTAVAPQPMRTDSNGRIQWNGVAIQASIDGDYSLLLLDSNQVQIKGGWSPTVSGDSGSSSDFSGYRPYGFTIADIKLVDVSVGDSIGNIGKETLTDGLGTDWVAVSNTGGTADDVDLIDFSNGLQGVAITNNLRSNKNLSDLTSVDDARDNMDIGVLDEVFSDDSGFNIGDGGVYVSFTSTMGWHLFEYSSSSGVSQDLRRSIPIFFHPAVYETYANDVSYGFYMRGSSTSPRLYGDGLSTYIYKIYKVK